MFQLPYGENKGFILLINILLIATISILIGGLIILLSLSSLRNSQVYINKNKSLALNNACAEEALYQIRQNQNYAGASSLTVDGLICYYSVENLGGNNRRLIASSTIKNVVSKTQLLLTVNASSTINISSWQEYP